jgi:hypothetical protein
MVMPSLAFGASTPEHRQRRRRYGPRLLPHNCDTVKPSSIIMCTAFLHALIH